MVRNVSICIFAAVAVLLLSSDASACRRSRARCLWLRVWVLQHQLRRLWLLRLQQCRRYGDGGYGRDGYDRHGYKPGRHPSAGAGCAARRGRWPAGLQSGRPWRASVGAGRAAWCGRWRRRAGTLTVHRLSGLALGAGRVFDHSAEPSPIWPTARSTSTGAALSVTGFGE